MSINIGALTTTFTPPTSCLVSDNLWTVYTTYPGNEKCYYLLQSPPRISDCLPKGYYFNTTAYYSPGICPSGYTAACSQLNTLNQLTETAYTCCPTARSFECVTSKSTQHWTFQSSLGCVSAYKSICALVALFWRVYRIGRRRTQSPAGQVQGYSGAAVSTEGKPAFDVETWAHSGPVTQATPGGGVVAELQGGERHEVDGVGRGIEVAELRGS